MEREYERKIDRLHDAVLGTNGSILNRVKRLEDESREGTCPTAKELKRLEEDQLRGEDMKWVKWGFVVNTLIMVSGFVTIVLIYAF